MNSPIYFGKLFKLDDLSYGNTLKSLEKEDFKNRVKELEGQGKDVIISRVTDDVGVQFFVTPKSETGRIINILQGPTEDRDEIRCSSHEDRKYYFFGVSPNSLSASIETLTGIFLSCIERA